MNAETLRENTPLLLIVISAVGYVLNLLFHTYLTNRLPADLYGDLAIALNVLEIAATLLLFGTEISALRYIPLLHKTGEEERFIRWNFSFVKRIYLYFFLFLLLSLLLYAVFRLDTRLTSLHTAYFILFAAPFSAVFGLYVADLNSQNNVITAAVIQSIVRYLLIWAFFILTLEVAEFKADNAVIVTIYIVAFALLAALTLYCYNRSNPPIPLKTQLFSSAAADREQAAEWKRSSFKNLLANLIFLLFIYVDKFILECVHSDESVVGHYSIIVMLAGLFTLIAQSASQVLAPLISALSYDRERSGSLQRVVNRSNAVVFLLSAALFGVYLFFGEEILGHFGQNGSYTAVYGALILLCVSQLFMEAGRLSLRFLLYNDLTADINRIIFLSLLLLIGLGGALTYFFGLYGLVAAHIITSFSYMTALAVRAKRAFSLVKIYTFF